MNFAQLVDKPKMFFKLFGSARGFSSKFKLSQYVFANQVLRSKSPEGKLIQMRFREIDFFFREYSCELTPYYEIFLCNEYENVNGFVAQPGWTILDVGANIGMFAIRKSMQVGPKGRIVSFEPSPDTFDRLQSNLRLNKISNVTAINSAVYSSNGEVTFGMKSHSTLSSGIINDNLKRDAVIKPITVMAVALDDFARNNGINHVDLMKIDVEGGELDVLTGAPETLAHTDRIVLEFHSEFLREESKRRILALNGMRLVHETRNLLYFSRKP